MSLLLVLLVLLLLSSDESSPSTSSSLVVGLAERTIFLLSSFLWCLPCCRLRLRPPYACWIGHRCLLVWDHHSHHHHHHHCPKKRRKTTPLDFEPGHLQRQIIVFILLQDRLGKGLSARARGIVQLTLVILSFND
jgi:hypothetical protein